MQEDEDIKVNNVTKIGIIGIIIFLLGMSLGSWLTIENTTPMPVDTMVDNMEIILYDIPYPQAFIQDGLTLSEIKFYYLHYNPMSRSIMGNILKKVCYQDLSKKEYHASSLRVMQLGREDSERNRPLRELNFQDLIVNATDALERVK